MPKKKVKFPVYVQAKYDGELDVPDEVKDYEEIQKYIKEHLSEVEVGPLTYIPETDEFDFESDIDIYYCPTKEENIILDGMKYRLIEKCNNSCCTIMDHGLSYNCSIYPLCEKYHYYCRPSGKIEGYLNQFENYEIRDAYADIDSPFSHDYMSYDIKRKKIKEYCNHNDFLHCNIIGICSKHNCSKSQDCYDITEDLKYKWSHDDINNALKIIEKNNNVTKL